MICQYCLKGDGEHAPGCPNYSPPTTGIKCEECGKDILAGEIYVVNYQGYSVHEECLDKQEMIKWLGGQMKEGASKN